MSVVRHLRWMCSVLVINMGNILVILQRLLTMISIYIRTARNAPAMSNPRENRAVLFSAR